MRNVFQCQRRLWKLSLLLCIVMTLWMFHIWTVDYGTDKRDVNPKFEPFLERRVPLGLERATNKYKQRRYTTFNNFFSARKYLQQVDFKEIDKVTIRYPAFKRRVPIFVDPVDETHFRGNVQNMRQFKETDDSKLIGEVEIIRNASFQMYYNCGYQSKSSELRRPNSKPTRSIRVLSPLIVDMAYDFQFFYDGTFPKLIQALPLLDQGDVKILLEKPQDSEVFDVLKTLKFEHAKIEWHETNDRLTIYHADYMVFTCVTPPMHPILWSEMRKALFVQPVSLLPWEQSFVILISREISDNPGKRIKNMRDVIEFLRARYGKRLFVVREQKSLAKTIDFYGRARVVIGTNAQELHCINFAPLKAAVVDVVPLGYESFGIPAVVDNLHWATADVLGQTYIRLYQESVNKMLDVNLSLVKLSKALDIADNIQQ